MTRIDTRLDREQMILFDFSVHLFAMNNIVNLHNRKIIKGLNYPIGRCVAESRKRT